MSTFLSGVFNQDGVRILATGIILALVNAIIAYTSSRTLKGKIETFKALKETSILASTPEEKKDLTMLASMKLEELVSLDATIRSYKTTLTWIYRFLSVVIFTILIFLYAQLLIDKSVVWSTRDNQSILWAFLVLFGCGLFWFFCFYSFTALMASFQRTRYHDTLVVLNGRNIGKTLSYLNVSTLKVNEIDRLLIFLPFKSTQRATVKNIWLSWRGQYALKFRDYINLIFNLFFLFIFTFVILGALWLFYIVAFIFYPLGLPVIFPLVILAFLFMALSIGKSFSSETQSAGWERIKDEL